MMCLRGSLCLYQGEELGLPEADIAFDELQDPYGIEFWPEFKGRDGCRTPMVWESEKKNGGFSNTKPWLPVSDEHIALSVDKQETQNDSLLHYYRKVIEFRKSNTVLIKGSQSQPDAVDGVVSFIREYQGQTLFCAFNLTEAEATMVMPGGNWQLVGAELGACQTLHDNKAVLNAHQALIAKQV